MMPSRSGAFWMAVVGLALAACAHAPEEAAPHVARVEWGQVSQIPRAELERAIETRGPSWFPWRDGSALDPVQLEEEVDQLTALYRRRGYYAAHVAYRVEPEQEPDAFRVVYDIDEGKVARIRSFELRSEDGALPPGLSEVDLLLPPGAPFDLTAYRSAKERLLGELGEQGFLAARLEGGADVDAEAAKADISWWIEPGPRIRAGATQVVGLEQVDDRLVLRERAWSEGDVLRPSQLADTQERLIELGLFRSVVIEPTRPAVDGHDARAQEDAWPVQIRVEERPPRTVGVSVGYGSGDRVRGRIAWAHRNLRGEGLGLELALRHSSLLSEASARFSLPHAVGPRSLGELSARVFQERNPAFDANRGELELAVTRPLRRAWKGRVSFTLDASRTRNVADATEAALRGAPENSLLSLVGLELERSTARPAEDPLSGSRATLRAQVSSRLIGSEVDFALTEVDLRRYWPWRRTVLAMRLRAGVIQPFGPFEPNDIPLPNRFYAGGGDSVRGFEYQRLGPLDAGDNPLGGTTVLVSSAELRVPLTERFGGVVFVDAGLVDTRPFHFPTRELRYSTGVGLRVNTPVGPVRVDLAHLLNPPQDDFRRFRVHLSIGHAF